MNGKHVRERVKSSTKFLLVMYIGWIAYVLLQARMYELGHTWFPMEMTYATAALFIVETLSLARLKMAKEGTVLNKAKNKFLEKIGLSPEGTFEEDAQKISDSNKEKEGVENDEQAG